MKTVKVKDLKVGDIITASDTKVITAPWVDTNTAKNKCKLVVQYSTGEPKLVEWNKATTLKIK